MSYNNNNNNNIFNDLLANQPSSPLNQALTNGQMMKMGNYMKDSVKTSVKTIQDSYQRQKDNIRKIGQAISNNAPPIVWVILFILFFIIIII